MSVLSTLRGRSGSRGSGERQEALAKRLEEHVLFTSRETHAYVDHRLAGIEHRSAVSREELERSSLLTVQEAKAYADEAANSLGMSLRGVSSAVVALSRRLDQVEHTISAAPSDRGGSGGNESGSLGGMLQQLCLNLRDSSGRIIEEPGTGELVAKIGSALADLAAGIDTVAKAAQEIERLIALPDRSDEGLNDPDCGPDAGARP
jgi:hypothetical protein